MFFLIGNSIETSGMLMFALLFCNDQRTLYEYKVKEISLYDKLLLSYLFLFLIKYRLDFILEIRSHPATIIYS